MPRGGNRPNSGRPLGSQNKTTIARAKAERAALKALRARLSDEEIQNMTPLQVLEESMRAAFAAGDIRTAGQLASLAAPSLHPKKVAEVTGGGVPADLQPDPPPVGDEPGPENPIY